MVQILLCNSITRHQIEGVIYYDVTHRTQPVQVCYTASIIQIVFLPMSIDRSISLLKYDVIELFT